MSQQINLLGPAFREKRRGSASVLLAVVAVAVFATAAASVYEHYRLRQVRAEAEAVRAKLAQLQAERDKATAAQRGRKPDAAGEAALVDLVAQIERRQEIVDALKSGVVGSTTGFSEFMRAFSRQSLTGVWLTGFDIDAGGNELTISGRALSADLVPRYLEGLNRETLMKGRQFSSLRIERPAFQVAAPPPEAASKDAKAEKPPAPTLRFVEFSVSTAARGPGPQEAPR